ncbi:WD40 repeat domain-containing protein [Actinomadura sp. LOL_016]|uniref:WD40 repeat domain-containing protein n=1 Tax=unclassified Actinomadura TaxID=2626254 RepID=UPI003A806058
MSLNDYEPSALAEFIDGWNRRTGRRPSTDRIADLLRKGDWLIMAAERYARHGEDGLHRLREGPIASVIRDRLAASPDPYPFYAERLDAILHATEAARHNLAGRTDEYAACYERALIAWSGGSGTPVAEAQVADLIGFLTAETTTTHSPHAYMSVPIRGPDGLGLATLVAENVERGPAGAWPCPRRLTFTMIDPKTTIALFDVVKAAREDAAGTRWWLVWANGRRPREVRATELTGPLMVLLESLQAGTSIDESVTVVGAARASGLLVTAPDTAELADYAVSQGKRVVVPGHAQHRKMLGGHRAEKLTVPDATTALSLARKREHHLSRRIVAAVAVVLLVIAGVGMWFRKDAAERARIATEAELGRRVLEQVRAASVTEPVRSLQRGLAVQRIVPDTAQARSALMNAVYGDLRLRRILHGVPRPLGMLVMARDGRRVAATNNRDEIAVWSLAPEAPSDPEKIRPVGPVTALGLSPDGTRLAYADTSGAWVQVLSQPNAHPKALRMPKSHLPVRSLAFSPDSEMIAAATADGTLLWRSGKGWQPEQFGRKGAADAVVFAPNGRALVRTTSNGNGTLWKIGSKDAYRINDFSLGANVIDLVFAPDGGTVYALDSAHRIHFIDARTGARVGDTVQYRDVRLLAATDTTLWTAMQTLVAPLSIERLKGGDTAKTGKMPLDVAVPDLNTVSMNGDGSEAVIPASGDSLAVYGPPGHGMLIEPTGGISDVVPLEDSTMAFALTDFNKETAALRVIDQIRGVQVDAVHYPSGGYRTLHNASFDSRAKLAAITTKERHVLVWRYDGSSFKQLANIPPHPRDDINTYTAFDERRKRLIVAQNMVISVYSYGDGGPIRKISRIDSVRPVVCVEVIPRNGSIVACTRLGLEIWKPEKIGYSRKPRVYDSGMTVRANATESGTVIGIHPDGAIRAFDIDNPDNELKSLPGPNGIPITVATVGNEMVTSSLSGRLHVIDLSTGEVVLRSRYSDAGQPPLTAWGSPGVLHLSVGMSGRRVDMLSSPSALAELACRMGGWRGPRPSIGDVVPDAPGYLRSRPLCPAGR